MSFMRPRRNGSTSGTSIESVPMVPKRPASASMLKPQASVGAGYRSTAQLPEDRAASSTNPHDTVAGRTTSTVASSSSCASSEGPVGSGAFFELMPRRRSTQPLKTYGITARPAVTAKGSRDEPVESRLAQGAVHRSSSPTTLAHIAASAGAASSAPFATTLAASPSVVQSPPPVRSSGVVQNASSPPSGLVHHFPSVGHYACSCGLPLFAATAKCRSFGGLPSFRRYFGPSLALTLSLSKMFDGAAQFVAACASCGADVGYAPLHRYTLEADDDDDVHVLRVTMQALQYRGSRAPPEFVSMETNVLGDDTATDATTAERARRAMAMRRVSGGVVPDRPKPTQSAHTGGVQPTDTSSNSDSDSGSDDECGDHEDDALWVRMRSALKRT